MQYTLTSLQKRATVYTQVGKTSPPKICGALRWRDKAKLLQSWRCLRLSTHLLLRGTHLLFWRTHLLFRGTHLLFWGTHLLFRGTHLLFRGTHLLFRGTHLLFRRCLRWASLRDAPRTPTHLLIWRVDNAPYWRVITQMLQKNCRLG